MRVNGRILRASTLAERRLLLSMGTNTVRVPRGTNPYIIARRIGRAAQGAPDVLMLRELVQHTTRTRAVGRMPPRPSPDVDMPEPFDTAPLPRDGAEG